MSLIEKSSRCKEYIKYVLKFIFKWTSGQGHMENIKLG